MARKPPRLRPASDTLASACAAVLDHVIEVGTWAVDRRVKEAERYADIIGSGADLLGMPEIKARKAEISPEELRSAVTGGIAILAHRPGGISFGGAHWCIDRHDGCPGPGGVEMAPQADGSDRGAVFTPRDLADEVVFPALEAVVYQPGPVQTADRSQWRLLPSDQLLAKCTGDIACGSGVFLLAACRYLADRLAEAWNLEAGLPADEATTPAILLHARHLAMTRVYGVDIDPTSVELARLAVALLAPTVPVDLTRTIVCGDALLGITSWDHIARMSFDPTHPAVFDPGEIRFLMKADILGGALQPVPWILADLVCGAALRAAGRGERDRKLAWAQAAILGRRLADNPAELSAVMQVAQEWLDTDLPVGKPSRRPLHWPLAFPEVFGNGHAVSVDRTERGGA